MGRILTREEWNLLIQAINDLATTPRSGCDPAPTLADAPEGHKWSRADIEAVRNTLRAICPDNVFSAPLDKWRQEIMDELYDAYFNGWCGCEETPCNDPVTYQIGLSYSDVTVDWDEVMGLYYQWQDFNQNGQIDPGEMVEVCAIASRYFQTGVVHPYPVLNGFQVYADFYVREWDASHLVNIRPWDLRRIYDPYTDEGICPYYPVHLPDRIIAGGELQPNGSIMVWGDPAIGGNTFAITDYNGTFVPLPGAWELRGWCFSVGLDNFTVAHGLPGGTLVGHIVCTDPRYGVNLVPHPNLYQVGTEIRTLRTFSEYEYEYELIFTLRATGNGSVVYGPFDCSFKLQVT